MVNSKHIFNLEFAFIKNFLHNKHFQKTKIEIREKEKEEIENAKSEKMETLIQFLPIVVMLLAIIVMSILYKIYM